MSEATIPPHMHPTRSFQGLILTLQAYWADKGCAILQPYDMEVGAGTLHPSTTLRALGPKRWNVAYVQPSRRPKDGRYGQNSGPAHETFGAAPEQFTDDNVVHLCWCCQDRFVGLLGHHPCVDGPH